MKQDRLYEAVCENCGMELQFKQLDTKRTQMRDGTTVKTKSYTCPKCDEEYIVSVYDAESNQLRDACDKLERELKDIRNMPWDSSNKQEQLQQCKKKLAECKSEMYYHDRQLKHKFLKELKRNGKRK